MAQKKLEVVSPSVRRRRELVRKTAIKQARVDLARLQDEPRTDRVLRAAIRLCAIPLTSELAESLETQPDFEDAYTALCDALEEI